MELSTLGKWMIFAGLGFIVLGLLLWALGKSGLPLGKLPGDIRYESEKFSFYFPIVTFVVISIVLTILLNIIIRFLKK